MGHDVANARLAARTALGDRPDDDVAIGDHADQPVVLADRQRADVRARIRRAASRTCAVGVMVSVPSVMISRTCMTSHCFDGYSGVR